MGAYLGILTPTYFFKANVTSIWSATPANKSFWS